MSSSNDAPPCPQVTICNVVLTFTLGLVDIELDKIAQHMPFMEYNPKKFAAGIMRMYEPRCTILMFGSGNMVCTGALCRADARRAVRDFASMLRRRGFPVRVREFKENNAVASALVPRPIRLNQLHSDYTTMTQYEPDNFPGCTFRKYFEDSSISFVVFRSGNLIITGAPREEDVAPALRVFYDDVLSHYLDDAEATKNSAEYRMQTIVNSSIVDHTWENEINI